MARNHFTGMIITSPTVFHKMFFEELPAWKDEANANDLWCSAWTIMERAARLYGSAFKNWTFSDNFDLRVDEDEDFTNLDTREPMFDNTLWHYCISVASHKSNLTIDQAVDICTTLMTIIDRLIKKNELRGLIYVY